MEIGNFHNGAPIPLQKIPISKMEIGQQECGSECKLATNYLFPFLKSLKFRKIYSTIYQEYIFFYIYTSLEMEIGEEIYVAHLEIICIETSEKKCRKYLFLCKKLPISL